MEIILKNVGYRYKNKKLLDRINFKIESNHIIGITGEYKTLLCELIDALKFPSTGSITVGNLEINSENLCQVRKEVALVTQNPKEQFFTDSLKEEMEFLISRLNYHPKNLSKKISQAFTMVGLEESYFEKPISTLSTGEIKLVQIVLSLIYNPSIIILDEPFVELDYQKQKKLTHFIKVLQEKYHKTILISSNHINLLYELVDDIIILKKGHLLAFGNVLEIYQDIPFLIENELEIPDLVRFTMLARKKKIKLSFHRDVRDLIKDVYKHVS